MTQQPSVPPTLDASGMDLHVTHYNSVQFLSTNLAAVDDLTTAADSDVTNAAQTASDLSGQDMSAGGSDATSGSAATGMGQNNFVTGSSDLTAGTGDTDAVINTAVDALLNAEQPLVMLTYNNTPTPPENSYSSLWDYISEQYPNFNSLPQGAQQQLIQQFCSVNPNAVGCPGNTDSANATSGAQDAANGG